MQKFKVQVETDAEYEVVLSDNFFQELTEQEWLNQFSEGFFKVDDLSDVIEHIILYYKQYGSGFLEGVGEVSDYAEGAVALIKTNYVYNEFTVEE
jgi:hypothetical protein